MHIIINLVDNLIYKYGLLFFLAAISAVIEIISIGLMFPLISVILNITNGSEISFPLFFGNIKKYINLEFLCIFLIIVFILKNLIKFIIEYNNVIIANQLRGKWMSNLFNKYLHSNYNLFIKNKG